MSNYQDSNVNMYIIQSSGYLDGQWIDTGVYGSHAIRPVINLKKCALDGTC